ncbi:SspB-related isopeptide-forming adhesin [Streptococcus canis]|uniref:Cell surface protein n=1 Tax=Streptococcus canis FSL Z3-227 TaxID=482234 RepID=A0AAV3FUG8_STRCB|nr:SspB-related isopeptide-forming adhesin [Streptococcus canis]EIQ82690.1 cell surface protein [Streptococcus canis FSL Z3-227]
MNQKQQGHGYFRKSKAYGLCGFVLAGTLMLSQGVKADEVVEVTPEVTITANPATNLPEAQPEAPAAHVSLASEAGTQRSDLVSEVTSDKLNKSVVNASEAGVTITTENKVVYDSLDKAQADLAKQETAVKEATAKQEANTEAIETAVAENKAIDKANADEKARVDALNKKGEADTKAKNEAGQKAVDAENAKAKADADKENAKRQADYDKALKNREAIIQSNEALNTDFAKKQADYNRELELFKQKQAEYEKAKASYDSQVLSDTKAQAEYEKAKADFEKALETYNAKKVQYDKDKLAYDNALVSNAQAQEAYEQALKNYERDLAAYNEALRRKEEAEGRFIENISFSIRTATRGVDNDRYGNSTMDSQASDDGSFTFSHDMIDGIKTIGYGRLTGKVNHRYTTNPDGSVTAHIDSITLHQYTYENVAPNAAVNKDISFRAYTNDGELIFSKPHDGDGTFTIPIHRTFRIGVSERLNPGESSRQIPVLQLHDDWIEDTHGWAVVSYRNDNRPVPNVDVPERPTPPTPPSSTPGQPPVAPTKPTPPTPPSSTPGQPPVAPTKPTPPTPPTLKEVPPTPNKPDFVTPVVKTFTPEVYVPVTPKVTPHVPIPKKEQFKVAIHPVEIKQRPTNVKDVINENGVSINNMLVPKGHLVHWELSNSPLKAGREETTSYMLVDPFPAGFEVDEKASAQANPAWLIGKTESGTTTLVATKATLDMLNADLTKDVTIPTFKAIGRPMNDGGTYENTFKTIIKTPRGQYTVTSNTPVIYTPGNDPKKPRPPHPSVPDKPGNPTPNDNLIQPKKDVVDNKGVSINGKVVLPNTPINYVLTQDFDQYEGMVASEKAIADGFIYIEDYQDDALDGKSMVVKSIKTKNGDDVAALYEMRHVLSKDELTGRLAEIVGKSGVVPKGEFYVWYAKDPAAFFKNYVQKGLSVTYDVTFKIKEGFTGKFTNQTHQIDFGNGYYGNIVENEVPELKVNKDIKKDGELVDKAEVALGETFDYVLNGYKVEANRGYDIESYAFVDLLTLSHDQVIKTDLKTSVDVTLSDGSVIKAGESIAKFGGVSFDEQTGRYEFSLSSDFLAKVPRESAFGADLIITVKRIKSGTVENKFDFYLNGIPVISDTVITETPEPPTPPTPEVPEEPKKPEPPTPPAPQVPEKPVLPKTGDAGSVLALVGSVLSGLGIVGLKRKKD